MVLEEFIDGQEVECAAIGNPDDPAHISTTRPGEILAGAEFYTYDDKYKNGVSQTLIPARLSEEKLDEVKARPARPIWPWAAPGWPAATSLWSAAPAGCSATS